MSDGRIVLIHATPLSIAPVKRAFARLWPAVEPTDLLEEALAIDRARDEEITAAITARIRALADYAMQLAPRGILFTCSAFGPAIEAAAAALPVPVLKPNEAMFRDALAAGTRIALVTTFPASILTLRTEFAAAAAAAGRTVALREYFVPDAMAALRDGDAAFHNSRIAETVAQITDVDAIMLGQFSMENALEACRARTTLPLFTAPESAVRALRAATTGAAG